MSELYLYVYPGVWVVLGLVLFLDIFLEYNHTGMWTLFTTAYTVFAGFVLAGGAVIWMLE